MIQTIFLFISVSESLALFCPRTNFCSWINRGKSDENRHWEMCDSFWCSDSTSKFKVNSTQEMSFCHWIGPQFTHTHIPQTQNYRNSILWQWSKQKKYEKERKRRANTPNISIQLWVLSDNDLYWSRTHVIFFWCWYQAINIFKLSAIQIFIKSVRHFLSITLSALLYFFLSSFGRFGVYPYCFQAAFLFSRIQLRKLEKGPGVVCVYVVFIAWHGFFL